MKSKNLTGVPYETALKRALQALDTQVAREMQRTPLDRERAGVQKWEPYRKRVENVSSLILEGIANGEFQLDGLLILGESFPRCLRIMAEELGEEGLGAVRSSYFREFFTSLERDLRLVRRVLDSEDDTSSLN